MIPPHPSPRLNEGLTKDPLLISKMNKEKKNIRKLISNFILLDSPFSDYP